MRTRAARTIAWSASAPVESALSAVGGGVDDEAVHVVADDRDVGVVGRGVVVSFVAFDGRACS